MGMIKYPYELSVWKEELNGTNKKIESKGVIIGAHDMSYLGKATSITLTRKLNGTNTLTFSMPDKYFDSLTGEYIHNELIDVLSPESKIKLHYKNRWYEFFIKKTDEKKVFKSYMKTFSCTDAFIDELSRNGYGITFDTELYNNVEELGTFTEEVLEDSIWIYAPQYNWGDFTEFKEEKLFKIPVEQFSNVSGYKLNLRLSDKQLSSFDSQEITNVTTGDKRPIVLSDDIARNCFWDQRDDTTGTPDNPLKLNFIDNIVNDGYIYVPYSCLNFCYGADEPSDEKIRYDRAATETALNYPDTESLAIAPASVDPRTIIQFYAFPEGISLEIDDAGVIQDTDYCYFMTLRQWNENVTKNNWYFFEDTRLVEAEVLGSVDLQDATISHTYRYIKNDNNVLNTPKEALGNKCVTYDGYLNDVNNVNIIKGKKFSITDRTEVNISEEIDQYVTVYNNHANEFANEYTSDTWNYSVFETIPYRVCSKIETRQIIPQLARNLVQNGTKMDSVDGWAPMSYIALEDRLIQNPQVNLRTIKYNDEENNDEVIDDTALLYTSCRSAVGYEYTYRTSGHDISDLVIKFSNTAIARWVNMSNNIKYFFTQIANGKLIVKIGKKFYLYGIDTQPAPGETEDDYVKKYIYICEQISTDPIYKGLTEIGAFSKINDEAETVHYEYPQIISGDDGQYEGITYIKQERTWFYSNGQLQYTAIDNTEISLEDLSQACSVVNFGIVGQQKSIEKNKIYCVGISAFSEMNEEGSIKEAFEIYIGEGSLIQDGVYKIDEDNSIKLDSTYFYPVGEVFNDQPNWDELDILTDDITLQNAPETKFIFLKSNITIQNPYIVIKTKKKMLIFELYLFECYTKGIDSFANQGLRYRYSGRDLFWPVLGEEQTFSQDKFEYSSSMKKEDAKRYVIFEDDIMLGSTYSYQQYFIQRLKATKIIDTDGENIEQIDYYDTCGKKSYVNTKDLVEGQLPLDEAEYSLDDCEIETNYIDLNKCQYYNPNAGLTECDCSCGGEHLCFYQRFGYCPYRFETEKHDRRIRTLSVSKSNRFNIIQSESKVFEVYPQFYIQHNENGTVKVDDKEEYLKQVYFITEKGSENKMGFRYEKNLKDISRNITSEQIVTKLYVLDVDSELSKTGLCSIKTAEDNPSADSYIIDLSYYIAQGMLDEYQVTQDLYGISPTAENSEIPSGFLRQLGYYNKRYDELTNNIINLQDSSFNELEANLTVNLQGIITAQEQILKAKKQIASYKQLYDAKGGTEEQYKNQATYKNYLTKLHEQQATLSQLIFDTFFTSKKADTRRTTYFSNQNVLYEGLVDYLADDEAYDFDTLVNTENPLKFFELISDFKKIQETWVDKHIYGAGILGQFNKEYLQIQQWKKERASYLKLINQISAAFYKKYEPYLKEGTWSDSNYLTDNAYYFGALDVSAQGAIPKVTYNVSVIDISQQNQLYEDVYDFDLADTTYVEDIGMFGINQHTGLPNRLKVLISEVSDNPDDQSKNSIKVQNFTTQFEDLFQQVTASVQSLTFNENIYKRSSNFTSLQNISNSSLQGALDTNDLTLLDTDENNITVDSNGTSGSDINNHANKYKLNGQGLYFSNDGGQHWSVGVGPKGINADYIKVGNLDAGKIRIADSSYVYFSWDKNGIVAYRDPAGINTDTNNINDMAIFNKYGLSVVNKGKIKLRAGYKYERVKEGFIDEENEQSNEIGFYLYNDLGIPIFSTTEVGGGARLSLTGEIFVNNIAEGQSSQDKAYTFSGRYTSDNRYYYDLKYTNGLPYSEGTYDIYYDNPSQTVIEVEGINYTIESKSTETIYGRSQNDYNIYELTKYTVTLSYDDSGQTAIKTVIFYYGGTKNNNKYYYDIEGSQKSFSFQIYTANESHEFTNPSSSYLVKTGPHYFGNYKLNNYTQDPNTNTKFYNYDSSNGIACYYVGSDADEDMPFSTYWEYMTQTKGPVGGNGEVALYINKTNDGLIDVDSRAFLCCQEMNGKFYNLFSILNGGNVYIGGNLFQRSDDDTHYETPTDLKQIKDRIQVKNPGIEIRTSVNNNNQIGLYMDFDHFYDTLNQGVSLKRFVRDAITDGTSGFVKNHWHWIDFDSAYWSGYFSDKVSADPNARIPVYDSSDVERGYIKAIDIAQALWVMYPSSTQEL